jgi:PilZ domain
MVHPEGAVSMKPGDLEGNRSERRRAPRYRYQAPLEIEWGSAKLRACTRDISDGGMFIEADDVLWVGAGFRARLAVERPLWLDCSVKRVEPGKGMGVTVELKEDQSQRNYRDLLAKLAES